MLTGHTTFREIYIDDTVCNMLWTRSYLYDQKRISGYRIQCHWHQTLSGCFCFEDKAIIASCHLIMNQWFHIIWSIQIWDWKIKNIGRSKINENNVKEVLYMYICPLSCIIYVYVYIFIQICAYKNIQILWLHKPC